MHLCLALGLLILTAACCPGLTPAGAAVLYVDQQHPKAADANPGTEAQPLKSISAGVKGLQPGDTLYVKEGVYREAVIWPGKDWNDPEKRITLSAFPGHRPIIKGSDVLDTRWERLPGGRPIYSCPRDVYTQMLFVDEAPLRQIGLQGHPERPEKRGDFRYKKQWDGKGVEDMAAGTFYYDPKAKRLYAWLADGGSPADHVIEAAVRPTGFTLRGTWTLSGFDVRHIMDGLWPNEQAVAVSGNRCVVERCRITHNEFLGLIVSGEECVIRGNEIAHNGLMGFTSNVGHRTLFEGNELHHNAWRGDVVCLTAGNKYVCWRDSRFINNWWHDEPAAALWLDINDMNILVAENRFDNCAIGVYFEISRWAVIANNVFRNCGRAVWIYSSDALVAHNVFDGCGEGVTISGYPRHCNYNQSVFEPGKQCLMAVRNNLAVNNLLIDCPGSFVGITEDTGYGAGNTSDYNAFVWTLPAYHRTGNHINFMSGWSTLYARLPEWRYQRHQDTHSVVADPGLLREVRGGSEWVAIGEKDVVGDARIAARHLGDYRLLPDSPLIGRGVTLPMVLNAPYVPGKGREIVTRAWAATLVEDGPKDAPKTPVWGKDHYRLQPLPGFRPLVDLDALAPGTPGLNPRWKETGRYPAFDASRPPETAGPIDWTVYPDNRLADPSFEKPIAKDAAGEGPWLTKGEIHTSGQVACANLLAGHRNGMVATQKVGVVAPECEYIVWGSVLSSSVHAELAALGEIYLAAGDDLQPLGKKGVVRAEPKKARTWVTCDTRHRTGKVGVDPAVGKPLYVVIAARVDGPAGAKGEGPAAFVRWDNMVLLTGQAP